MKTFAPAFALAVLFANAASAIHYEISEHVTTRSAHVEVTNGDHASSDKRK